MKTIQIIELLNKIVNNEEVPDKVKWKDTIYYYAKLKKNYYTVLTGDGGGIGCTLLNDMSYDIDNLNDEVKIIEEDNKIKKLDSFSIAKQDEDEIGPDTILELDYEGVSNTLNKVYHKINELIDKVNNMERRNK